METTSQAFLPPVLPYIDAFISGGGHFKGRGQTSQGYAFEAEMRLESIVGKSGIQIEFSARDSESAFHVERTWIAEDLLTQRLQLWTLSQNTPGVLAHRLVADEVNELGGSRERRFVFRLGEPDDHSRFRQEITLDFHRDGHLEYRYSWAVPHEPLKPQVHAHLSPIHQTEPQ